MKQGGNAVKFEPWGLCPASNHRMEEGVESLCTIILLKLAST